MDVPLPGYESIVLYPAPYHMNNSAMQVYQVAVYYVSSGAQTFEWGWKRQTRTADMGVGHNQGLFVWVRAGTAYLEMKMTILY